MLAKLFAKSNGFLSSVAKTATQLEGEINAWLKENPGIRIVQIKQSSNGGSLDPSKLWVSILYEPDTEQDR